MSNGTNPEIHADAPNTAEVVNKFNENSEQEKYFAKEKVGLQTELGLAKQERTIGLSTVEEDTHNDADDLAESSDTEYQNILTSLPNQLQDINKQLRFTARKGKTREIRHIAREYRREFVKDMKYTCKTLGIYFRKLKNGRFDENMITPEQMAILNAKTQARHEKIKGFIGDTLTGDNMFAERGNKKDVFVGPDMKTSTDGVEVRGTCTPAEAEAAMGRCQGGGSLAKQERCKFVDQKSGIKDNLNKFLTPGGANIVTGAVKMIPTIIQIWGGRKAVKAGFGLIMGKDKEKNWKDLAIGAGMFGAVTFLDPTKSYNTIKSTFGDRFGKGGVTGSGGGNTSEITDKYINEHGQSLVSKENMPTSQEGMVLAASAFGGPATMSDLVSNNIIKFDNNEAVSDIDFGKLKGIYSNKYSNQSDRGDLYGKIIQDINNFEKVVKAVPAGEKRKEFIRNAMTEAGIGKDIFDNIENKDKPLGAVLAHKLTAARHLTTSLESLALEDKIYQDKSVKEYITQYGAGKFMKEIMKLPDDMREKLYEGEITLSMEDNILQLTSENQTIKLDITKGAITSPGKNGYVECPLHFTSVSDLIVGAITTAQTINQHQKNYMISQPFFYKKSLGERGNKMSVSKDKKSLRNPLSWLHGKNTDVVNGGWYSSLDKTCPTIYNHMEIYTTYINDLNIWKNDQADNYINTSLIPQLKTQYPGLTDAEYTQMASTYFGLYATRGNIDALAFQNWHTVKDPIVKFVDESYKNTKEFIKPHYETIKQRTTERTEKGWNKIQNNATDIYNDAGDLKTRIASKRDSRDTVLRGLVKESGIAIDKVEHLTFNQLPQEIGNLIANIILGAGRIVYHTGTGVVEGIRGNNTTGKQIEKNQEITSIQPIENIKKDFSDAQIKQYQSILPKLKINGNNLELSGPSSIEDIKKFGQILIYHYNKKTITKEIIDGNIGPDTIKNLEEAITKNPNNIGLQQIKNIINTYTNNASKNNTTTPKNSTTNSSARSNEEKPKAKVEESSGIDDAIRAKRAKAKDFSDAQIKQYQSILPKLKINGNNLELSGPSSIEDIKKFGQILIYHYNKKTITKEIIDGNIGPDTIKNLEEAITKNPNNIGLQQIKNIINTYTNNASKNNTTTPKNSTTNSSARSNEEKPKAKVEESSGIDDAIRAKRAKARE